MKKTMIVGPTNPTQFLQTYGNQTNEEAQLEAAALQSAARTKVIFRTDDEQTAEWLAGRWGK